MQPITGSPIPPSPFEPRFGAKGGNQNHKNHVYEKAQLESQATGRPISDILADWYRKASGEERLAIQKAQKADGSRNKGKRAQFAGSLDLIA